MEKVMEEDISRWCQEKGVHVNYSLSLVGNLSTVKEEEVLKFMEQVYGLSYPCIVDKRKEQNGEVSAMLLSGKDVLDRTLFPGMIILERGSGRKIQIIWPEGQRSEEEEATQGDDQGAGEPITGVNSAGSYMIRDETNAASRQRTSSSEPQVEAVVDKVVSHLERWHFEGGYRRLRIFSGITPVPAGEETYDMWREAAIQHSEEWQCPEHIRKQRVVESLHGPAMRVIQATRRSNPIATLREYIEALDFSFGTLEDVGDMLARLNGTYQNYGETLTQFIYRVDRLIYKIVDKGGLTSDVVDERRLRQILKGALTNSPIAQKLRCTMTPARPPTLNELVRDVKLEEVQMENREKSIKKVKVVLPTADPPPVDDRLLRMIEEQNKKIDQLIALQISQQRAPNRLLGVGRGDRRSDFRNAYECYSCGQFGHRSFECPLRGSERRGSNNNERRRSCEGGNSNGSAVDPSQTPQ
ncbi:paraneoplastic antigen Ma2 homolog [Pseudophryne corroboree]|uniref:paraneoplastic antigen Ma2 homolog n=1 Tax=Pseudophryne corroboree TaxID=495146 RepID=UPI003081E513